MVPEAGVMLTDALATKLHVGVGDVIDLEVLEGDRRVRTATVTAISREVFGMSVHMSFDALHGLLGEEPSISSALLRVDPNMEASVDTRLKQLPAVGSVGKRKQIIEQFKKQSAESMKTSALVLTLFGCAIAVAIVYNNARISLSVRGRDLASLRVLGFTRREISVVLLGELGSHVVLAIPPGLWVGRELSVLMMGTVDAEMFRLPVVISPATYAFSAGVTVLAALGSALIVRNKLDELDLVGALKARE
jgi:putative ABC transport system permease protein